MAELIQFNCPACSALLRLPLSLATSQGPCPVCGKNIVAPDPSRGRGAYVKLAPVVAPPQVLALAENQSKSLPAKTESVPTPTANPARTILFLSCLLTALVAFVVGYAAGEFRSKGKQSLPLPLTPPIIENLKVIPPAPIPEVKPPPVMEVPVAPPIITEAKETGAILVKPKVAPSNEENHASQKVSAAAEASLRAFLEAPDWPARSAYVLRPEQVRSAMEAYSKVVPDGATPYNSIKLEHSQTDLGSGNTLFIFKVTTEKIPEGIPVAVVETDKGWLIDWEVFVEFRDDQFKQFVAGPAEQTGRFHLIVRERSESDDAKSSNEHFVSFLLDPPFPGREQTAFVKKDSKAYSMIVAGLSPSGIYTPVLEITKLSTPDGKSFLEIIEVLSPDWRPAVR